MGTPTEAHWPGVSSLPHWQALFPQWPPLGLAQARARHQQCGLGPRAARSPAAVQGTGVAAWAMQARTCQQAAAAGSSWLLSCCDAPLACEVCSEVLLHGVQNWSAHMCVAEHAEAPVCPGRSVFALRPGGAGAPLLLRRCDTCSTGLRPRLRSTHPASRQLSIGPVTPRRDGSTLHPNSSPVAPRSASSRAWRPRA